MKKWIKRLILTTLKEDLKQQGDVTSQAIFKKERQVFTLVSKDEGILCGKAIFKNVIRSVDQQSKVKFFFNDGQKIKKGDQVARIKGKAVSLLKAERTALNFISHLSAIATKTELFTSQIPARIKILDTRKTIPGLRKLQKYAVACGGGVNHRMGLYDVVLIKDNHIDAAGSITKAVQKVKKKWHKQYKIIVETRNINEVEEALSCQVDRIMLDNMDLEVMQEAITKIDQKAEIEVSGNVTFERLKELAGLEIDFISIGELTHTVKAFDFSLKKLK